MDFNYNGYIVQRENNNDYRGVEGDNWYLNYESDDDFFRVYYDNKIDKAWENSYYVDCCADKSYIEKYIQESNKLGIRYRVLLCMTCKEYPFIDEQHKYQNSNFLGYDYAYSGGSYYSSVLNDIVSKRIDEFKAIRLNNYNLFEDYGAIKKFSTLRNEIMLKDKENRLEKGDFIIYKLYDVEI